METLINEVKRISAGRAVVMPAFGDAESMATAAVLVQALGGDRVTAVNIDHGMLRLGETEAICSSLKKIGVKNVISVDLGKFFLISSARTEDGRVIGPLATVCNPADKRYITMSALSKEYERIVAKQFFDDVCRIGVHTVGGEPLDFGGRAEEIACAAGASEWLIRQPFPIQALSIRMLCNESVIALTTAQRNALEQFVAEKSGKGFFAKLAPFRSVGVRDGVRSYKSMAVLSGVCENGYCDASDIASGIDVKLGFINRVLMRVDSSAVVQTLHGSPMHISAETLDILRKADAVVSKEFAATSAVQFFAVLLPLSSVSEKKYSIAIRAVSTSDFKTAVSLVPGRDFDTDVLRRTASDIKAALPCVDMVLYDVTPKPPAAIEFE